MSNLPKPLTKYGHVTLQIPKIFIFHLILYYILGTVTTFWGIWLKNKKVTGKKQIGDGKHPPVLLGLISGSYFGAFEAES